jgi:glycosyltransferase involved in cell wall biosynthesis
VLPILIDFARYAVAPRPGLARLLRNGMKNLLFVGRLAPNKQQEELLKLFKLFQDSVEPRSRLILVGKPDRHRTYAAALLDLVRENRVDNVLFAGSVDHADLCTYYRSADLFVSASAHEGFCVPLLEAFYFDLPVLALHSTAVPSTLGGAGLSYDGGNAAELCELMALLLENSALRDKLLQGQRRRLEDFATDRVAQTLRGAIEAVLA